MLKRAMIALGVVAAIAAAGAYLAFTYLDVVVKWTFEHYGPDVTGVTVKVREVQISPRNGRGSVRSLELGNPAGFSAARAARFGEIRLQVDPSTITSQVIVVRELTVDEPLITYERAGGTTNLEAIQRNIERYVQQAAGDGDRGGRGARDSRRRFIVERLTLRGAKVTMTNPALKGQGITFDIPDITLRDVGRRQNGLTASEIANLVANTLISRIAQRVLSNFELLRKGGIEGAVDALKGLLH